MDDESEIIYVSPTLHLRRSVAIVGSSGSLIDSCFGSLIDFDNVDISDEGYSNSPPNFVKDLRDSRLVYIGPDLGPWANRSNNSHDSNELFLFGYSHSETIKKTFGYREQQNLQVGTIMILLCVNAGIKPTLSGFVLEPTTRTHYYENRPANCSVCHNATEEQKLISRIRDQGLLTVIEK